jgi:hypothetical protein
MVMNGSPDRSREEWAFWRRNPYGDEFPEDRVSDRVSAHATPTQITAAIAEMRALWLAKGRAMPDSKVKAGWRVRQARETRTAYHARWLAMTPEDRKAAMTATHRIYFLFESSVPNSNSAANHPGGRH